MPTQTSNIDAVIEEHEGHHGEVSLNEDGKPIAFSVIDDDWDEAAVYEDRDLSDLGGGAGFSELADLCSAYVQTHPNANLTEEALTYYKGVLLGEGDETPKELFE